ncbi:hypothetical protein ACVBIL_12430 [Shewanella sp. 125m-7]
MNFNRVTSAVLLSLILSGCGSDDDNSAVAPPIETFPLEKYSVVDVNHQPIIDKVHRVSLGRYDDKVKAWIHGPDGADLDKDGKITVEDAHQAGVFNDPLGDPNINSVDIFAFLEANPDELGKYTARPDIFVQGQYSVFDVLRYVVHSNPQLRFESVVTAKDSPLNTTEFVLSYDANNNGDFSDDGEYSNSDDWFYRFKTSAGDFQRDIGEPAGEANYARMDEMWAQDDMDIRFQPFGEAMTARRFFSWKTEMERLDANNGKYVIPELRIQKEGAPTPYTYVRDLEVFAHDLRPDVFQPGVITAVDIFMSAIDAGYDYKMSYWPVLDTGSKVYSYSINRADGLTSTAGKGWLSYFGEDHTANDFTLKSPSCKWDKEGKPVLESAFSKEECIEDFQFIFGGDMLHLMTDVWVMPYPKEYALLKYSSHYPMFGFEEYNGDKGSKEYDFGDGDVVTLEKLLPATDSDVDTLLTESHYGWGKADCMLCHESETGHMNGAPLPVNSVDGFDQPQAYFCATCHGTNGGSDGHGATARCFWCHSDSKTPEFHGDAFSQRTIASILDKLDMEKQIFTNGPAATHPRDAPGNRASYTAVKTGTNSDWSMSKHFPDPYSCMTCHPNK